MKIVEKVVLVLVAACLVAFPVHAEVDNLKIITDASPDYSDMDSMIHSISGKWQTPEEKLWAMFYWNHIARRQTSPMMVHGVALSDPIRQFNAYGYTMCSTIAGINCSMFILSRRSVQAGFKFFDSLSRTLRIRGSQDGPLNPQSL